MRRQRELSRSSWFDVLVPEDHAAVQAQSTRSVPEVGRKTAMAAALEKRVVCEVRTGKKLIVIVCVCVMEVCVCV